MFIYLVLGTLTLTFVVWKYQEHRDLLENELSVLFGELSEQKELLVLVSSFLLVAIFWPVLWANVVKDNFLG